MCLHGILILKAKEEPREFDPEAGISKIQDSDIVSLGCNICSKAMCHLAEEWPFQHSNLVGGMGRWERSKETNQGEFPYYLCLAPVWRVGSPVHLKKEKGGAIRITKQLRPNGESCKSSLIPPKHLLYHMMNAWLESQRHVSYLCREHASYTDMSFERLQCFHVSGISWSHWSIEISYKNPGFWFSLENGKIWTHWALTLCGNLSSS